MTDQQRENLPTISGRAGGDPTESTANIPEVREEPNPPEANRRDGQVIIEAGQPPQVTLRHTAASSADDATRRNMQNTDGAQGEAGFTKGDNSNTMERTGLPYTADDMARQGVGPARGADVPAGSGATPISADRDAFLADMVKLGHFADADEADTWATAVFNALRERALESDKTIASELGLVVRVGEAPEVQVAEMIWGGDFVARLRTLIGALSDVNKGDFLRTVATYAKSGAEDPWVEGAVYSFFGALKSRAGDIDASRLGELGQVWQRTQ
ncbi:MAG TPA: hypothetical protein VD886_12865 [Herpetosiphonaceae bacterium]|nr:hypothetical protein [Herpetosiphonaceae bacterium]